MKLFLTCTVLATLIVISSADEGKRISKIKCEEYIRDTVIDGDGVSKRVKRIVDGEEAREDEFPHHALLGYESHNPNEYSFDCGGTLISDWYILTAANCIAARVPIIVRLGELNLNHRSGNEIDKEIDTFIRHPNHTIRSSYYDIALIKLKQRVSFSSHVRPACLWDDLHENFTSVIATGFGVTDYLSVETSDVLRKVQLEIMDSSICQGFYTGRRFSLGFMNEQMCIGSTQSQKNTCQGDGGGPVQVLLDPKRSIHHVVGVTSFGAACGRNIPSVYTRVASYIEWIESIVWA